jgi:hypothetical protein
MLESGKLVVTIDQTTAFPDVMKCLELFRTTLQSCNVCCYLIQGKLLRPLGEELIKTPQPRAWRGSSKDDDVIRYGANGAPCETTGIGEKSP